MAVSAVAHLDEIEDLDDAGCRYRPIRHHLGISAFGGKAYDARGWELWAPLAPLYGRVPSPSSVALVAVSPQYPMLFFNLACCESQLGRTDAALDHLRVAIGMSEEFRDAARSDSDLDPIRDEAAFQQLLTS